MLEYLSSTFDLGKNEVLPEGRYHNNFDFFKFPDFGMSHLRYKPMPPLPHPTLSGVEDLFEVIRTKDQLVHVPYQSYDPVVHFFEKAAEDPDVTHIKVIQYRVAKNSRIINALLNAIKLGKQVSVFVEIKARFDEANNLEWGEKLQKAGARVYYSFPGVKVHSKLALVRRLEDGKARLYGYLATGNFHEDTAKVYADFGLFTVDTRLVEEVSQVFRVLENIQTQAVTFNHLLVGKNNLRPRLYALIDREIEAAKRGEPASMILKLNSLEDKEIIRKLYDASRAGVKIQLIIRGICCAVPGVVGMSENMEIISIVDRFLEHARVLVFHNGGQEEVFLSSADWMERNLSYRIETTFPIYDPEIKAEILECLRIQLADNVKARIIDQENLNEYKRVASDIPIRSQIETYFWYKRIIEKNIRNQ
jgi:polyphosphate kinase